MLPLILATKNKHKASELAALLAGIVEVNGLPVDFPDTPETGTTLEENARIKARAVFESFKIPTVADDTGLQVTSLDGAPGVYTARYAGEAASYEDNYRKLIQELEGKSDRSAVFSTVICYIDANGTEHLFRGDVGGSITKEPKGAQGFGYDPVFIPGEGNGKTFAEMSSEEKNKISHRSRAVMKLVEFLKLHS